MTLYLHKKQNIVYEAAVFNGGKENADKLLAWLKRNQVKALWYGGPLEHIFFGSIPYPKTASVGDYIIKGVDGVFMSRKPDHFKDTFEEYKNDVEH